MSFDANPTLGALLVAAMLSSFLFGILTVQVNFYYAKFSKDSVLNRILVALIWCIELAHLIAVCLAVHIWTISEYGQPNSLAYPPHALSVSILISGFIAPAIQAYFADRIRALTSSIYGNICTWTLWFFAFVRFLGSLAIAAEALKMISLSQFEADFRWLIATTLAVGTCADTIICVVLSRYVRPKFSPSRAFIASVNDQLVAWTMRNGLVTCVISISTFVSFFAVQNAFIWHSIFVVLTRVFSNFFLSSLNSRSKKSKTENSELSTEPTTLYTFSGIHSAPRFAPPSVKDHPTTMSIIDPLATVVSRMDEDTERMERFPGREG